MTEVMYTEVNILKPRGPPAALSRGIQFGKPWFKTFEKTSPFGFCNFTMRQKQQKKLLLMQTDHRELNSVTSMIAKVDIDTLKV